MYQQGASGGAASFTSSIGATLQRVGGGSTEDKGEAGATALRPAGDALPGVSREVGDAPASTLLPFDQEAKLIYGVVYSLRNLVRKLGGKSEQFYNFSTSTYTLSHLQTPTMYTFVMITDPPTQRDASKGPLGNLASSSAIPGTAGMTLRGVLNEIWRGPWIEHATRHPLVDCTERERYTPPLPPAQASAPEAPAPPQTRDELGERVQRTHGIDNDGLRAAIEKRTLLY